MGPADVGVVRVAVGVRAGRHQAVEDVRRLGGGGGDDFGVEGPVEIGGLCCKNGPRAAVRARLIRGEAADVGLQVAAFRRRGDPLGGALVLPLRPQLSRAEMLGERGVEVDHTTLYRWAQRYAPELEKRTAWYRSRLSFSWRVDETYGRVKGRWKYEPSASSP